MFQEVNFYAESAGGDQQMQLAGMPSERDALAQLYAALMRERYGPSHPATPTQMHRAFADSVLARDVYALRHLTDALRNGCARDAFMSATGVVLPLGEDATWAVLLEWAGVGLEEDALREAHAKVDQEAKALVARVSNAAQAHEWVERQVAAGFDTLKQIRKVWWLIREDGEGFELSSKAGNLHRLRPLIAAVIDRSRIEAGSFA